MTPRSIVGRAGLVAELLICLCARAAGELGLRVDAIAACLLSLLGALGGLFCLSLLQDLNESLLYVCIGSTCDEITDTLLAFVTVLRWSPSAVQLKWS